MKSASMKLLSIQVGLPKTLEISDAQDAATREWTTGFCKEVVVGSVWAGKTNLTGDGQADLCAHGGLDKAINAYPFEHYAFWRSDLGFSELLNGAFGENFTVQGMTETDACVGDIFEVGGALVQISQPRQPCEKLSRWLGVRDLAARVDHTGKTGWYFRVLHEGSVEAGMTLKLVDRPHPEWTITAANNAMLNRKVWHFAAQALAECPALSDKWRMALMALHETCFC